LFYGDCGTKFWSWAHSEKFADFTAIFPRRVFETARIVPERIEHGVPDGGSTVSLLGFGLLGLAALRRK
jgi:hypothetical protein